MQPDDDAAEPVEEEDEGQGPPHLYLTHAGAERLHAELLALLKVERPRVTAEVSAAAAQGDRSENAEYIYGKKRLREIDRRIRFLQRRLDSSTVVDPREQKDLSHVYFGATLVLEDEEGKRTGYQLVGADETDARGGRISVDSPLGRALLGKRLGASVTVSRPRGEVDVTIVEIKYE
jgi:transcription elongation factor GreB